jgi:hypothetical protein
MQIQWPEKIARDAYVRVYATFSPEELALGDEGALWDKFVSACYEVLHVVCTEDNTVGQIAQMRQIKEHGTCSGGHNLYGMRVRPIIERVNRARMSA